MNQVNIVEARPSNYYSIKELAYTIWPISYKDIVSADQIKYMLESRYSEAGFLNAEREGMKYLLAQTNGENLGYCAFTFEEKHIKLNQIYVLPDLQKSGIGKKFMEHVFEVARIAKSEYICLTVNRGNPAVSFYEHLGFNVTEEKDFDIGNGYFMNDFIMKKMM